MTQDPGWRPPQGLFVRTLLLPHLGIAPKSVPVLVAVRTLVLVTPAHFALFLSVLWALEITPHGATWHAVVLVALGFADLQVLRRFRMRPLPGDTLPQLAASFRALFLLGYALAYAVVLWGFVFYFLTGRMWIYLLGLPFGIVMLTMIAPTKHALELGQREIDLSGREISLGEALMLPGRDLPSIGSARKSER